MVVALAIGALGCAGDTEPEAVSVSAGPSPFADCGPERAAGGFVNVGSEVEPSLAVDPSAPERMVVVYQQDRWSNGKARGIAFSRTANGGEDWERGELAFSACVDDRVPDERAGDPWISGGPDGALYAIASGDGILASYSRDGGATWSAPSSVDPGTQTSSPDKPAVTAHPTRPGVAYAVWGRVHFGETLPPVLVDATYARTDDGGRTWSRPQVLVRHEPAGGTISSQILVGPRGVLYHLALWEARDVPGPGAPARILLQRSSDDGRTWTEPQRPLEVRTAGYAPLGDNGELVRTGVEAPTFAIDPASGRLYAAWQDARYTGGRFDQIAFSTSSDGGRTWASPRRLGAAGVPAAVPTIAVDAEGRIGLSYYTFRLLEAEGETRPIEARVWLAVSTDRGRTFESEAVSEPVVIDDGPKAISTNGQRGVFLGDYMGLVAADGAFLGAYVLPQPDEEDSADVLFFRRATS